MKAWMSWKVRRELDWNDHTGSIEAMEYEAEREWTLVEAQIIETFTPGSCVSLKWLMALDEAMRNELWENHGYYLPVNDQGSIMTIPCLEKKRRYWRKCEED